MWNDQKSVTLSRLCIAAFALALAALLVAAPGLVKWFMLPRGFAPGADRYFLMTIYLGAVPASGLLHMLHRLLQNISAEAVFIPENVELLRRISWCCFLGAAICLASGLYFVPWYLIAVAAAFMGLIVRVVKNLIARAVSLQDEVDHTV